ncbi:hypothetical protein L596_004165 [Steinernema carpocapsae]|uniref:Uncharacterized protein n=1 Tax=Steinernema carpocapsae TaxID=34508 RepID=A0A4U8UV23_STECR|nr:hypothetical protein L596_004165 [Steinernema carpocapsae]
MFDVIKEVLGEINLKLNAVNDELSVAMSNGNSVRNNSAAMTDPSRGVIGGSVGAQPIPGTVLRSLQAGEDTWQRTDG